MRTHVHLTILKIIDNKINRILLIVDPTSVRDFVRDPYFPYYVFLRIFTNGGRPTSAIHKCSLQVIENRVFI